MLIDPYRFRRLTITGIIREARHAVSVQVEKPNDYSFACGQHAVVRVTLPDGTTAIRQYSFSSAPTSSELWLTITKEGDGVVSSWFHERATVGATIELTHPFNGPLVQKSTRGDLCMIAGGSGIAPLMSTLRERRLSGEFTTTLLYTTRADKRCFEAELAPLAGERIIQRITDTETRFNEADIRAAIPQNATVLLCGSREFVVAMRALCETIVPAEQIHAEAFSLV